MEWLGHIFESKCAHKFNELVLNEFVCFDSCFGVYGAVCVRESVPKPAILAQASQARLGETCRDS